AGTSRWRARRKTYERVSLTLGSDSSCKDRVGSTLILRSRIKNRLARQLETGQEFRLAHVFGAELLLGPLRPAPSQNHHAGELCIDDPVFLDGERPIFLPLLRIISIARAVRHNFDDE